MHLHAGTVEVKYQHTDALGSPVAMTNAAGQVVERTHWEPYGAAIGKTIDGIGYTGHVMDAATGLTYMQQRYYDPQCGCFLSVDPVTAYSTGDMRFFNRYAYAFNNPYKFKDPDGRSGRFFERYYAKEPPPPVTEGPRVTVTAASSAPSQSSIPTLATVSAIAVRPEVIASGASWVSATAGAVVSAPFLYFFSPHPCGGTPFGELTQNSKRHGPGVWPGDKGAEEWGRRNGVGADEGRRKFHDIKQADKGQGGGKGNDNYGTNPKTGDVVNPQGEVVGNLEND